MNGKDDQWQREFSENLKRAGQELALGVAEEAADSLTRVRSHLEERRTKRRLKEEAEQAKRDAKQRKLEAKQARREAKRRKFEQSGEVSRPVAWVYALFAAVMAGVAFINLDTMWWMFFVAFGFAVHSATLFGKMKLSEGAPLPSGERDISGALPAIQQELQSDPLAKRLDEACDRLERSLAQAPAHVREFLSSEPEQTVKELRTTCRDLLRRERSLRSMVSPEEVSRLERGREELNDRITRSTDDIVRGRLYQALAALQHQQAQQKQLAQSADRLEAERMRLGYTLEGLNAQVMRLQFADSGLPADAAGAGLRISLEQLRDELGALAEAAEEVNRLQAEPFGPPIAEVEPPTDDTPRGRGKQRTR